jgi:hypothetical protein
MMKCIVLLMLAFVLAPLSSISKWTEVAFAAASETRAPGLTLRLIPLNGPSRVQTLDGIGCSEAICSRVFVRTFVEDEDRTVARDIPLDTVAAIEPLGAGHARVRFISGTVQRLVVPIGWRVLYLLDDAGRTQKVDLSELHSIEVLR